MAQQKMTRVTQSNGIVTGVMTNPDFFSSYPQVILPGSPLHFDLDFRGWKKFNFRALYTLAGGSGSIFFQPLDSANNALGTPIGFGGLGYAGNTELDVGFDPEDDSYGNYNVTGVGSGTIESILAGSIPLFAIEKVRIIFQCNAGEMDLTQVDMFLRNA